MPTTWLATTVSPETLKLVVEPTAPPALLTDTAWRCAWGSPPGGKMGVATGRNSLPQASQIKASSATSAAAASRVPVFLIRADLPNPGSKGCGIQYCIGKLASAPPAAHTDPPEKAFPAPVASTILPVSH